MNVETFEVSYHTFEMFKVWTYLLKVNVFTFSVVTLGKKKDSFVPNTVP